jgi:glycosyltransferase involved in cell wall biosynthesis
MLERQIKISVITPSYNQAQYIQATINSVLSQNYPALEYLVMDGGSKDGTVEILRRYEDQLSWVSEPDKGQADAINKGFKQSAGEIVTWLNSDDLHLPGVLHRVSEFFNQHPEVDVVYGDYYLINHSGAVILRKQEIPFDYNILLYGLDYIGQPTTFFRRRLFDRIGYLDESLHFGLDWDYWLRVANSGGRFAHIPHYLAATRWHTEAKTLVAPPQMYAEHQAIRERYWQKYRFRSTLAQNLYAYSLNKGYRLKRQLIKLLSGRIPDFPPGHWVISRQ